MTDQSIKLLVNYYNEIKEQNIITKKFVIKNECPFLVYFLFINTIIVTLIVGFVTHFHLLSILLNAGLNIIVIIISCVVPQKLKFQFDCNNDTLIIEKLGFLSCIKCGKTLYYISQIKMFKIKIKQVVNKKYIYLFLETINGEEKELMSGQKLCKSEEEINNIPKFLNLILNKNNVNDNNKYY